MITFGQWLKEEGQVNETTGSEGPEARWEKLIELHRIQFTPKFAEKDLQPSDRAFVCALFEHFKYTSQQPAGNTFKTKLRGCNVVFGYFGKQNWAVSLETPDTREVTEKFQVTETKIQPLINLIDKAIKQQTFKNILPVVNK